MAAPSLLERIKARKLAQWALAYLAGAWALVEATNLVVEQFSLPTVLGQGVTVAAFFGFFLTLVVAWYHGERGYQRLRGSELLVITVLLIIAGTALSQLEGGAESGEAADLAGLSAVARFAALGSDRPAIAVLPLANLSADPDNAYFAAGIHEELLRVLSLVRSIAVISRTSVLQYAEATKSIPEIARELGARYIVEGSVQEAGDRVRIQVQLIDAASDEHVWAERYDRSMDDLFALQSEVALAIAGALETAVSPEEQARITDRPTQDPIAYDLYVRAGGMSEFLADERNTAIDLLRRATQRDPAFARAHARLAQFYRHGRVLDRDIPYDSALARAQLAFDLAPDQPYVLSVQAFMRWEAYRDQGAAALLQRALALDPSDASAWSALSFVGWTSGDHVGGALAGRQTVKLDPNGSGAATNMGYALLFLEMHDELTAWSERAVAQDPRDMWAWHTLTASELSRGDYEAARRHASGMLVSGGDNVLATYYAAMVHLVEGNLDAAETALAELCSSDPGYTNAGGATAEVMLAWVQARAGRGEGPAQLEDLRRPREALVAAGSSLRAARLDLMILADVGGDEQGVLHWFQELTAAERDAGYSTTYLLRRSPWLDRIRQRPEFQEWKERMDRSLAAQRREMAALGPWMPEEVLGGGLGT